MAVVFTSEWQEFETQSKLASQMMHPYDVQVLLAAEKISLLKIPNPDE